MDKEIEVKLTLESFTDYLKLMGFLGQVDQEVHQRNAFFDTESRVLSQAGWALRVRVEGNRGLVTAKSLSINEGPAFVRQEIEAEIGQDQARRCIGLHDDVLSLDVVPIQFLKEKLGGDAVSLLVKFDNTRQKKTFRLGDHDYVLEVDKTEYADGSVDYELEVELTDVSRVEQVDDRLRRIFDSLQIPYQRQAQSKLERALIRAGLQ